MRCIGIPCLGVAISAKDLPQFATFVFQRSIRSRPSTLADTSNVANIVRIPSRLSVLKSTSATLVSAKPTPPLIPVFLDLLRRLTALVSWRTTTRQYLGPRHRHLEQDLLSRHTELPAT